MQTCFLCCMSGTIIKALNAAADLLLPRRCIVCGRILLTEERHLCLFCMADLPLTHFWNQTHNIMADRFNSVIQEHLDKSDLFGNEQYAYAAALFFYNSDADYRKIPYRLKYHGARSVGRYFGKALGKYLATAEQFRDVDLVVPVPLHWTRKWERGYNQAEVIALEIADELHAEAGPHILRRVRRTRTQTKLGVEEKARNVKGAFEAISVQTGARHILLVDDVFTTGSTLTACFTALRSVFPPSVRISVATLGFVGRA